MGLLLPFELELECDLCCASASAIALCGLAASGDVGIIDDIGDSSAMGSAIATGMKEARRRGERAKEGIKRAATLRPCDSENKERRRNEAR